MHIVLPRSYGWTAAAQRERRNWRVNSCTGNAHVEKTFGDTRYSARSYFLFGSSTACGGGTQILKELQVAKLVEKLAADACKTLVVRRAYDCTPAPVTLADTSRRLRPSRGV